MRRSTMSLSPGDIGKFETDKLSSLARALMRQPDSFEVLENAAEPVTEVIWANTDAAYRSGYQCHHDPLSRLYSIMTAEQRACRALERCLKVELARQPVATATYTVLASRHFHSIPLDRLGQPSLVSLVKAELQNVTPAHLHRLTRFLDRRHSPKSAHQLLRRVQLLHERPDYEPLNEDDFPMNAGFEHHARRKQDVEHAIDWEVRRLVRFYRETMAPTVLEWLKFANDEQLTPKRLDLEQAWLAVNFV